MMKFNLTLFGGRGAGSDLPTSTPGGGGGGGRPTGMDAQPGMEPTTADALGQKGRPMATTAAVSGANPYYNMGPEYRFNCQRCVVATEARFRGYDVEALPTFDNDTMHLGGGYLTNFVNPNPVSLKASTARGTRTKVEQEMASYGDGARAILRVGWSGGDSGHVMTLVQRNGRTHYYDGQDGSKVDSRALFSAINLRDGAVVTRVDNLAFSDTANAAVRPRKR